MRQLPRSAYSEPFAQSRTSFVGRTTHLAAVGQHLRHQHERLITLTGPGGVGKTHLALQAAALHAGDYENGCHVVVLADVRTPETVLPAICRRLGLREDSSADHLAHALRDQHVLLVLDNLEHVTATAPDLAALLERCPLLTIMATSRTPLRIHGEIEYPVPPLALPDLARIPRLDELQCFEAIALFVHRARAVRPDFALTAENGPLIAEICTRLDGLPLAIELAAARLKVLSSRALLARLSGRLQLLTGGARDQPPRLQSLRDAIAWSYDLLDPAEQALFRRLSVFAGDFTLDATETVFGGQEPEPVVPRNRGIAEREVGGQEEHDASSLAPDSRLLTPSLDLLAALVDHSLVQRSDRDEDEPRYRLLETIRAFALEQMTTAGEEAEARARHAAWYLALAESAAPAFHGPEEARWHERLAAAEANLRAAQDWILANHRWDLGLRLGAALYDYWLTRGTGPDVAAWLEAILAIAPDTLDGEQGLRHARLLNFLGTFRYYAGDHEAARAWYDASLARRRSLNDQVGEATTLSNLAVLAMARGDPAGARPFAEESVRLGRRIGNRKHLAWSLGTYTDVLYALGQHDRAWAVLQETTALWRDGGEDRDFAYHLIRLGKAALDRGELETARQILERALALCRRLGDEHTGATVSPNLSRLALAEERCRDAADHVVEALGLNRTSSDPMLTAELFDQQAAVAVAGGQAERAARLLGAADALYAALGTTPYPASQPQRRCTVTTLEETLGEERLATLRTLGGGSSIEQATAEAVAVAAALNADAAANSPTIGAGDQRLTRRELEILRLLIAGRTNREIGAELFLSHRTVATHVSNLLAKLGTPTRTGAVAEAVRRGLIDATPPLAHIATGDSNIDAANSVN